MFASICSSIFDGKWLPKWSGETWTCAPRERPKRLTCPKIDFWKHFGSPLAAFWLSLALFRLPVAIFLPPFVALWFTFAHHRIQFSNSWCLPATCSLFHYVSNANLIDVKDFHTIPRPNTSFS